MSVSCVCGFHLVNCDAPKNSHKLPDGSTYEGEMKEGKPHGKGTRVFPEGHQYYKYEGQFVEGLMEGEGNLDLRNGCSHVGTFKNDQMVDGVIIAVDE